MDQRLSSSATPQPKVRNIAIEMLTMATALGLETGDRAKFVEMKDGQFSIIAASHTVQDLKGLIRKPASPG
ncbi:hypothetical protein [Pseudomonas lurida]|uniref:hypothetical protein n=1 Tax=Pseudomonas lurida TaxID=244566 RepID=UPI0012548DF1|nr:hypothetical protein PS663_05589 [Pseudomonas fluorescens]